MHIDSYFSLSNSDLDSAEYVIFGIPYDATQSFKPGSRFAPNAIREASWNIESYSVYFDYDLSLAKICDAGNINVDGDVYDIMDRVSRFLKNKNIFPIAIGGEHTISYFCVRDLKDICYVVFDAHFDLRNSFDGSDLNHACSVRRIYEKSEKDELSGVFQIGVRSGTPEERKFAEKNGIRFYYSWEIYDNGMKNVLKELETYDRIYLSLDVDAFDPSFAPGVSTPEPFGLHPFHFLEFISGISDRLVGFDIVEVVPDTNKVTQSLSAKLIAEVIASTML